MSENELITFFHSKRAKKASRGIDWKKKQKEWTKSIDELYTAIRGYLSKVIADGTVTVEYRPKTITEEPVGTYEVKELVLRVGEEIAVLSPKGMYIVGASGRVDLRGDMGVVTLVLQPGRRWAIVEKRVPILKTIPFEPGSFFSALKDVMRP
jgi:hypothetical protein